MAPVLLERYLTLRLRNEKDPVQVLNLTHQTWFGLLDLAEAYGWRPVGPVELPDEDAWDQPGSPPAGYDPAGMRYGYPGNAEWEADPAVLVVWEDALGLADSLEQAFLDYEPLHVPASFFLFAPEDSPLELRPSLGAITETARFCRLGAFYLEPYTRP
jgi:CO/xanthine dehydrogenase Mo-binding subunit